MNNINVVTKKLSKNNYYYKISTSLMYTNSNNCVIYLKEQVDGRMLIRCSTLS